MAKVKTNLKGMTLSDKITLTSNVVTAMTGNPNFVAPMPALTTLTTAKTAAIAAKNGAETAHTAYRNAINVKDDAEKALDAVLTQEALYVENASGGDATKIESSGFLTRSSSAPIGPLAAPGNLFATVGDNDGELDLQWDGVRGANSFVIHKSSDPPNAWAFLQNSTESRARIMGLTSGTKYWFKVAGVGAAGQGAFSDPCCKIAP